MFSEFICVIFFLFQSLFISSVSLGLCMSWLLYFCVPVGVYLLTCHFLWTDSNLCISTRCFQAPPFYILPVSNVPSPLSAATTWFECVLRWWCVMTALGVGCPWVGVASPMCLSGSVSPNPTLTTPNMSILSMGRDYPINQ